MAHIVEFTVEGLAGRDEVLHMRLNEDVNVFFGENGSGKTTLLKILHAAIANETDVLQNLPFIRAEVQFYLKRYDKIFTRSITQNRDSGVEAAMSDTPIAHNEPRSAFLGFLGSTVSKWAWRISPDDPDKKIGSWKHGYLPISRLYRGLSSSGGSKRLSEEALDQIFATSLQKTWSSYYTDISEQIQAIQEDGLASILQAVLSTSESQPPSEGPEVKEAYKRVSDFLSRQPKFANVLGTEAQFEMAYRDNTQLRKVVENIEVIEERLKLANEPREHLKELLNTMFSGHKRVLFDGKEIQIVLAKGQDIRLPLLSSGEKQLLLVALEGLVTSNHILIVDEPELSMHIDWQRRLVTCLMALNPDMQLIMATHSPDIMADLPDNQIFRI